MNYLVGIDEVGRGPLAGPLVMGGVWGAPEAFARFVGIRDSKKLSEKKREEWAEIVKGEVRAGTLRVALVAISNRHIDAYGMTAALFSGVTRVLSKLEAVPSETDVLLDGSLRAPAMFVSQKTIIRGDESEPAIALASIMAKVMRDRHMVREGARIPGYGFEKHKGYGTAEHCEALRRLGPTEIHRKSFISKILGLRQEKR